MFQQALALHQQGRLDEAARAYEAVLRADPSHAEALINLGMMRLSQGQTAPAAALLQRAVVAHPGSARAHMSLGAVAQAAGGHAEAIGCFERALRLDPALVDAHFGLGMSLATLGKTTAAIDRYEQLLTIAPDHAEAHYSLALLLTGPDRAEQAIAHFRAALAIDPDFAEAAYHLGSIFTRAGDQAAAIPLFEQALSVDPDYTEARLALAVALRQSENFAAAVAAFNAVLSVDPSHTGARYGLAVTLTFLNQHDDALAQFRRALAGDPTNERTIAGLANTLIVTGHHDEAVSLCRTALRADPDSAPIKDALASALTELGEIDAAIGLEREAFARMPGHLSYATNLVKLITVTADDPVMAALETHLRDASVLSVREQCNLHFALAKAHDDLGDRDRGFDHLLRGNALKRRLLQYNEAGTLGGFERLRAVFTPALIGARHGQGDPSPEPVFIVGMPRSGTTLVEQILASHPMVAGGGERFDLPRVVADMEREMGFGLPFPEAVPTLPAERLRHAGASYAAALRAVAPGARRITDKLPSNFRFAGLIPMILPRARIIHLIRDPVSTCLSCFGQLFSAGQDFSYDLAELGRYYRAYQQLMAHWRAVLPPGTMLEVEYEQLVTAFETEVRRIVAWCDLPWDDACLDFHKTARPIQTASVMQVRQPIYQGSVRRWRPDEALLRPLLDALEGR